AGATVLSARRTRVRSWSARQGLESHLPAGAAGAGARPAAGRAHTGRVLPGRVRSGGNIDNLSRTSRRTHRCGELRAQHVGQRVRLGGWVHRRRDLGGIVFIDLRDRAGIVQVAVGPSAPEDIRRAAAGLAGETVVELEGEVVARPGNMRNPELATGEVEVHPSKLAVVGPAVTPAIPVARAKGEELPTEELRLKYRHLDLRRPEMQANLVLRHRLLQRARRTLAELEFLEIETPILTKPTPEGALWHRQAGPALRARDRRLDRAGRPARRAVLRLGPEERGAGAGPRGERRRRVVPQGRGPARGDRQAAGQLRTGVGQTPGRANLGLGRQAFHRRR